ncbi:DNA internalization-related competence protein ComEC/Rec2 [Dokdonella sp.]|uniref:DNA internalization-related competence protein ComEC/Rec2 n=1 Tax=Dokdonella sp. TaxID=2291710 RepID=UPI0035293492
MQEAEQSSAQQQTRSSTGWSLPSLTPLRVASLLAGSVAVHALPSLVPSWLSIAVLTVAAILLCRSAFNRAPVWFLLGFAWTLLRASLVLDAQLPDALHGRDFDVAGTILDLPQTGTDSTRFSFAIESAELDGEAVALRGKVRLNWYDDAPVLAPCSHWSLRLRLRSPRGFVNPGGNDGERSAAQRGWVAAGYVRDSEANRQIAAPTAICADGWRQSIAGAIGSQLGSGSASTLLRALAVGDQQTISQADWQVLRATGTGHLIAISGLHVGLFAAFGALLARGFWKAFPRITLGMPGPLIEAPVAMACAFGYGMLAGMGVPTLRTLLMIAVALLARYSRRSSSVSQALALAATAIVLWDPLAALSAGFWLSFSGVAILLLVTRARGVERPAWRELPRIQLMLSLAVLPMTVWFFGQGSLIGPLANLIAVPWISLVIVPLTVTGSLLVVDFPSLGLPILKLAEALLGGFWPLMEWMSSLPSAQRYFASAPLWACALALIGTGWSLLPWGPLTRALGLFLLLPLIIPSNTPLADGEFEVWMLDVGQGLSVFVRTSSEYWLYDAGPRYPSGFDVGDAVVVPSLHALGVDRLDLVTISHGDSDHAGGASAVRLAFPEAPFESGEPERLPMPAQACRSDATRASGGVTLRTLVAAGDQQGKSNDRSCVLAISSRHGSLLLTGDATTRIEPTIASGASALERPLVLQVPHHGSKTASSTAFLDALAPQLAVVSSGYRNQFRHPAAEVRERYAERSIALLNTAETGYLRLRFVASGLEIERGREARSAWWRKH